MIDPLIILLDLSHFIFLLCSPSLVHDVTTTLTLVQYGYAASTPSPLKMVLIQTPPPSGGDEDDMGSDTVRQSQLNYDTVCNPPQPTHPSNHGMLKDNTNDYSDSCQTYVSLPTVEKERTSSALWTILYYFIVLLPSPCLRHRVLQSYLSSSYGLLVRNLTEYIHIIRKTHYGGGGWRYMGRFALDRDGPRKQLHATLVPGPGMCNSLDPLNQT